MGLFVLFRLVDVQQRVKGENAILDYVLPWQTVQRGGCIFSIILHIDRLSEEPVREKGAALIKMFSREEFNTILFSTTTLFLD